MSDRPNEAVATSSGSMRKTDAMARLRELHLRRNEARKLNHQEVVEEDKRNKLPANWEMKRKQVEWEEETTTKKKECAERGDDYDVAKYRDMEAGELERLERKRKKKNPDQGFADFEQASFRQYQRLTKQMKPNPEEYMREKEKMGEDFYPTADSLGVMEHKDNEKAIDRMVDDLDKQIARRAKYSRRRAYDPDEDITYINERNMNFNKKLERFYGKYTAEIKQNLERGTAI